MRFKIEMEVEIDPDANFWESDPNSEFDVLRELVEVALYDIDDLELLDIEITKESTR